jgi:hypothetical protein
MSSKVALSLELAARFPPEVRIFSGSNLSRLRALLVILGTLVNVAV